MTVQIPVTFDNIRKEVGREIGLRKGYYVKQLATHESLQREGKISKEKLSEKQSDLQCHLGNMMACYELLIMLEGRRNELPADIFRLRNIDVTL